jgi:hypothetical protein
MERTKAITAAAVVAGALLAGSLGMTANAGILSGSGPDKAGQLSPLAATPTAVTAAAQPDVTTAVPGPTADAPSVDEPRGSGPHLAPPTTAAAGGQTPTATAAKPATAKPRPSTTDDPDPEPQSEPPETTTPRVTAPPVSTSTTAPAPTTTTHAHHDDDHTGTGLDD